MTHARFVGYVYRTPHYFGFDYQLPTDTPPDKMAEFWQNFGRKKMQKNLHISKKSSTFVA